MLVTEWVPVRKLLPFEEVRIIINRKKNEFNHLSKLKFCIH